MKWIAWGTGAVVAAALLACGATANAPGDGASGDAGKTPIYDGGSDYRGDSGGDGDGAPTCTETVSPENCGACGNVCPGLDASADNVTCSGGEGGTPACNMSCQGENYDVDNDAGDGCEITDAPLANHTQATAVMLGSFPCNDGSSAQNIMGEIVSDERVHEDPSVAGFNAATGSATDYFNIFGSGGSCVNDLNLGLQITGSLTPACYSLTAVTDVKTSTCTADSSSATCNISNGSGSYGNKTTIIVSVSKVCSSATHETAHYIVTGHL